MSNLGWLFYKDYFRGIDYADLANERNEKTINDKVKSLITQTAILDEDEMLGNTHFKATTTYPGLILGSGNTHELPDIKGQAILGFSFDYTSGLPVIAGSSVKGVLRSAFKHPEYIQELLEDEMIDVEALEAEIFDNGDVFYDAVIIANANANILGDDYITPHGDALKNPIPLRFVKVMPNVSFRFDFELASGLVDKSRKTKLFQEILSDLGLGAKTNVGYGKFDSFAKVQTDQERDQEAEEREERDFVEASKSGDLEKLEKFKRDYPNTTRDIESAIEGAKGMAENSEIDKKYTSLDKSNKNHVKSFVEKYKNSEHAKKYIDELEKCNSTPAAKTGIEGLSEIGDDAEAFKKILHDNKGAVASNRDLVQENVMRICATLDEGSQNKFLKIIKLNKYVDKAFEKQIKEALGR